MRRAFIKILLIGFLIGISSPIFASYAASPHQETDPDPSVSDQACKECHLDIFEWWSHSPHAHAFDDPVFQERWSGLGKSGQCLLCHTTNYQASSGTYSVQGVSCEACHGQVNPDHPPAIVPIRADTEYCGTCHTTTINEWRLTGHSFADVGCMDCHDPHSQKNLFEDSDLLCINCHKEDMGDYLEDLHVQKDIGCVDCHALVIPPDPIPVDGIVPTGHAFVITPATCVACHTDALHAGFSLPGYENGASARSASTSQADAENQPTQTTNGLLSPSLESDLTLEQRLQSLEAALASRRLADLFQGGIIGLVLGSSTAWFIAQNVRRSLAIREQKETNNKESSEEEGNEDGKGK